MPVTPAYRDYVLDQLRRVVDVRGRAMFGGVGIYAGEAFFALIADDVLYLKVDERTQERYEAAGMQPFRPYGAESKPMSYFGLPEEVLEDAEELRVWVDDAVAVARRSRRE